MHFAEPINSRVLAYFIGKMKRKILEYIVDNRHATVHLIFEEVQDHNGTHLETDLDEELLPTRFEVEW